MQVSNNNMSILTLSNYNSQKKNNLSMPVNSSFHYTAELYKDASFSIATPENGGNASAYYSDNYTDKNPLFIVKGKTGDGTYFEEEININNINPKNASFLEMVALSAHLSDKGKYTGDMSFVSALDFTNKNKVDYFSKRDYISPLESLKDMQQHNRNYESSLKLGSLIDSLLNRR